MRTSRKQAPQTSGEATEINSHLGPTHELGRSRLSTRPHAFLSPSSSPPLVPSFSLSRARSLLSNSLCSPRGFCSCTSKARTRRRCSWPRLSWPRWLLRRIATRPACGRRPKARARRGQPLPHRQAADRRRRKLLPVEGWVSRNSSPPRLDSRLQPRGSRASPLLVEATRVRLLPRRHSGLQRSEPPRAPRCSLGRRPRMVALRVQQNQALCVPEGWHRQPLPRARAPKHQLTRGMLPPRSR